MSVAEAEIAAEDVGLKITVSAVPEPVADPALDGKVVTQNPDAGVEVVQGSTITVSLGQYVEPTTTTTAATTTTTEGGGG